MTSQTLEIKESVTQSLLKVIPANATKKQLDATEKLWESFGVQAEEALMILRYMRLYWRKSGRIMI